MAETLSTPNLDRKSSISGIISYLYVAIWWSVNLTYLIWKFIIDLIRLICHFYDMYREEASVNFIVWQDGVVYAWHWTAGIGVLPTVLTTVLCILFYLKIVGFLELLIICSWCWNIIRFHGLDFVAICLRSQVYVLVPICEW